jgi:hypothetical protein
VVIIVECMYMISLLERTTLNSLMIKTKKQEKNFKGIIQLNKNGSQKEMKSKQDLNLKTLLKTFII